MPDSWAFARVFAKMIGTVGAVAGCLAALAIVLMIAAPSADAAPYPPQPPCAVAATRHPAAVSARSVALDVVAVGLDAGQPVRVSLHSDHRILRVARADGTGSLHTVVAAPTRADGAAPDIDVATARSSCSSDPTGGAGPPNTPRAGNNPSGRPGPGQAAGGSGTGTTVPSPVTPTASTSPTAPSTSPSTSPLTSGPASSPASTPASTSPAVPRADPPRISGPSLGIGLAIAAALLVLGTLAVLVLTRRPEH